MLLMPELILLATLVKHQILKLSQNLIHKILCQTQVASSNPATSVRGDTLLLEANSFFDQAASKASDTQIHEHEPAAMPASDVPDQAAY